MDISSAVFDPELGSTSFTVERITYTRSRDYPLSTGIPEDAGVSFTGADRIHWNGQNWRVVKVRDWSAFGYVQAYAVLLQETN